MGCGVDGSYIFANEDDVCDNFEPNPYIPSAIDSSTFLSILNLKFKFNSSLLD